MAAHNFTVQPAYGNGTVALPRIDTRYLQLNDFLDPNANLYGFLGGRTGLNESMGMQFDYKSFSDYTELSGRVEATDNLVYYNWETGLLKRPVKIATIVAGSTQGLVTITLDAADAYTNVSSINGNFDRSPLKTGDVIMTRDEISGYVVSKTGSGAATQYVIQRRDGVSDTLLDSLTSQMNANVRLITYTIFSPEGSRSPEEGIDAPMFRLKNQVQTFRSVDRITGDVDTVKSFNIKGQTKFLSHKRIMQEWEHRLDVNRAMMLGAGGQVTLPGTGPGTGLARLTTGLLPGVRQQGATFEYDFNGGYTAADIDALDAQNIANYAGNSFTLFEGFQHGSAFQKGIVAQVGAGAAAIDYTAFGKGDGKQKAIDMGFRSVTTANGITYHRQTAGIFNEPGVTAEPGYRFPKLAIFVPGAEQKITTERNGEREQLMVPSLRLLHTVSSDGIARRFYSFTPGGLEVDGIDNKNLETFTQQGIQVVNLRNFTVSQPG